MFHTVVLSDSVYEGLLEASSHQHVSQVLSNLADGARAYWIQLAGQKLNTSRRDYINGIQKVNIKGLTATIELVGSMPNMVEHGATAFDMHETLLSGPNVNISKEGHRWRVIPFKHQTPNSIGQGGGVPMGRAYAGHPLVKDARALGNAVHRAAKNLQGTTSHPGGKVSYGGRLDTSKLKAGKKGLNVPKLKPHHSTDIYAGMIRSEKAYGSKTQSTYTTFRVISDAVPDKWQHPGIEARDLSKDVEKFLDEVAPMAFGALFND